MRVFSHFCLDILMDIAYLFSKPSALHICAGKHGRH
jgi:hypothetical protein